MKVVEGKINSSTCGGPFQARFTFLTTSPHLASYIMANRDKRFNMQVRREDGLSAALYSIDEWKGVMKARVIKDQVIFNAPATILIKNGKKYVSKAHKEEFDEEKGLLMCLAKANGISHLELKRMIKNAKRPKKKDEGIVLATNPVQNAYDVLLPVLNKKKVTKNEILEVLEEAIGYLGEALDD